MSVFGFHKNAMLQGNNHHEDAFGPCVKSVTHPQLANPPPQRTGGDPTPGPTAREEGILSILDKIVHSTPTTTGEYIFRQTISGFRAPESTGVARMC